MAHETGLPFNIQNFDMVEATALLTDINQRYSAIINQRIAEGWNAEAFRDDLGLIPAFSAAQFNSLTNPLRIGQQQLQFWSDATTLWHNTTLKALGLSAEPVIEPTKNDHRFRDDNWQDNPLFDFIKQAYLLAARCIYTTLTDVDGVPEQQARKVEFFTRQFIDALAPTNFWLGNPEVQREFFDSGGMSFLRGLRNLLRDIESGKSMLKVKMTDPDAFELGKNVATTPGKVVMQTDMMQLIQYQPSTKKVNKRPLLIVPPWINKYYILDLREKNSFIKWAVDQGHTVFVISWINPDADYAEKSFDDYLLDGTLAAVDGVVQATGEKAINSIGYCLGGTLLASTLAYMAAKRDQRIKSATFFASMMDFACPGELGIFIDKEQLEALDKRMERGYLDGAEMSTTFNMMRANDLVWSFFVNNYLLGKEPFPFDLLYWNSDSTRMPANMHRFYLHNMYLRNRLSEPGGITLNDTPIDLGKVKVPTYFLSTIEDHIAPWQSTYVGTQLLKGKNRFVLGGSGHIAGVINPPNPDKLKYGYWTNDQLPEEANEWLEEAEYQQGSWWPDWQSWISKLNPRDKQVAAREPGKGKPEVLEDAPGSYAKRRIG